MRQSETITPQLDQTGRLLLSARGNSLLERFLTPSLIELLRDHKTKRETTLADVIRSGLSNPDSSIGVYAPEADAYRVFAPLFDSVIETYHRIHLKTLISTPYRPLSETAWSFTDEANSKITSVRIRACRSLSGFPMHGKMTRQDYQNVEAKILSAFQLPMCLPTEVAGAYHPLTAGISTMRSEGERAKGLWPQPILQDKYLCSAGANAHYPVGRGVYINHNQDTAVWINEEDHLRVMVVRSGGDVGGALKQFDTTLTFLEQTRKLEFEFDDKLGYLTFCPSNLGTTIRLSVLIHLPQFDNKPEMLQELAERYGLQIRGLTGEHSSLKDSMGIYDVSNVKRLGLSEVELITQTLAGVELLVRHS